MIRRSFSVLTLREGMELVPAQHIADWNLNAPPRPPSDSLHVALHRLQSFHQHSAKRSYVDALLAEVVPDYPRLKVWHGEPLESPEVGGDVDYLFAPSRGYADTPFVCAATIARRDDFDDRMTQCIAEMAACRDNNIRDGHDLEVYGIVSNGQVWVFYRLTRTPEVFVSGAFTMNRLPELLGALDHVIAACADNIP